MPRNAVMKHMLTIYTFALSPVSTTVRNLSSSIVQRFIGTNSRKKFIVWYLLLRVNVHLSWTKLGLADPFLRNRNFVFRCGMHVETLPVQMTEVAVTWQKGRHILGVYLSVTSQLTAKSRIDLAENAYGPGWTGTILNFRDLHFRSFRILWRQCSHENDF